jgi:hypothetical protein
VLETHVDEGDDFFGKDFGHGELESVDGTDESGTT